MITQPANYQAAVTAQHIISDWLLEVAYSDSTPGTFYFSGQDRTVTNKYAGLVEDWGEISEEIDLANSVAMTADITITLLNKWNNASGLLSDELFGGSKKFLNQDVTIRSWLLGVSSASDCVTRFVGRLVKIKHNLETVTFTIEKRVPWDRLKIDNGKHSNTNLVQPYAVGLCSATDKRYFPVPTYKIDNNNILALPHPFGYQENDQVFYYERTIEDFVEITGSAGVSPATGDVYAEKELQREAAYLPQEVGSANQWDNASKAFDGTAAYASDTLVLGGGGEVTSTLVLNFPAIDHTYTSIEIRYTYSLIVSGHVSGSASLQDNTLGTLRNLITRSSDGTSSGTGTITITPDYSGEPPSTIKLNLKIAAGSDLTAEARISDVDILITTNIDFTNPQEGMNEAKSVEKLYSNNSGVDLIWTGETSGLGDIYPHNVFRTLLNLKAGWDASAEDDVHVNGVDWSSSSIDTDRNWLVFWWSLKQLPLPDVLKQLQFEGGFIWVFDYTSSTVDARIIYVKSSYSSADKTLDGDYLSEIEIDTTPVSEIVTKRTFNYDRNPATGSYRGSNSKTNTNRGNWNLATEENAIEQNLDWLYSSTNVDSLLTYYDNIVGEPKIVGSCSLDSPEYWNLQVGDIVKFSNMEYDPYGKSWSSIYFMITGVTIQPDSFKINFREVG